MISVSLLCNIGVNIRGDYLAGPGAPQIIFLSSLGFFGAHETENDPIEVCRRWKKLLDCFLKFFDFVAKRKILCATAFYCFVISAPAYAAEMQQEIDHLLQFVEHTHCQYERNGKMHSGEEAAEHIRNKYNYFKNDIDSAEKFIELSATKSTISGKYYLVHCPNLPPLKSQDWLLQELNNYRIEVGS